MQTADAPCTEVSSELLAKILMKASALFSFATAALSDWLMGRIVSE